MSSQTGLAFAFFDLKAESAQIKEKIRSWNSNPIPIRFSLSEGLMKMNGDKELNLISRLAKDAGRRYTLRAGYRDGTNEQAAIELKESLNNLHLFFQRGEKFYGAVVYKSGNHYFEFDSAKPFLPELMEILEYDEKQDIKKLAKLMGEQVIDIKHMIPPPKMKAGTFYVIYLGDRMIGVAGLLKVNKTMASLNALQVDRNFWGLGIGEGMVKYRERKALEMGFEKLIVNVEKDNSHMQRIMARCGFEKTREFPFGNSTLFVFEKIIKQTSIPFQ